MFLYMWGDTPESRQVEDIFDLRWLFGEEEELEERERENWEMAEEEKENWEMAEEERENWEMDDEWDWEEEEEWQDALSRGF
ncbi:hypothetical protein EAG_10072 [Camponotus floridanus]|uniref:Uncharacterized protein n=1 Tax=Camponotus floridanus TaxID=104421 RepID=E2A7M6_CAMFO|nr:hypothetical protein EAG_10072 [Camponotus floridanus]